MPTFARPIALTLLLTSAALPGAMQMARAAQNQPADAAAQAPAPAPVQAPVAARWSRPAAAELIAFVEGIGQEGLEPAAYQPERLRAAIEGGDEAEMSRLASEMFLRLSADLSGGFVRGRDRVQWFMADTAVDGHTQQRLLAQVSGAGGVADALNGLLPTHAQYAGLKRALARTSERDTAKRDVIRANMERWRWMPRSLGSRHVIVNVPAFTAAIVDNGQVVTRHKTVVGATRTPTPQLASNATGITFNPYWTVPRSIQREMRSFAGFDVRGEGANRVVRQPPGPRNALGRIKIEMPNEHAIFLHDTPAQNLFGRNVRAFSHGCIRTQNIRDFAAKLLEPTGEWQRPSIDSAIAAGDNKTVAFAQPVPVYIAYFTAAATNDGDVVTYEDIYGRDQPVKQALNLRARTAIRASRDTTHTDIGP